VALLNQMRAVIRAANVPLIIVEIPRTGPSEREPWLPAVPEALVPSISSACDVYLPASSYLAGVRDNIHVPHDHRHITERTHERIAEALDRALTGTNFQIQKQGPGVQESRGLKVRNETNN
jgi:hypothetical protein